MFSIYKNAQDKAIERTMLRSGCFAETVISFKTKCKHLHAHKENQLATHAYIVIGLHITMHTYA